MSDKDEYRRDPIAQVIAEKPDNELIAYFTGVFAAAGYMGGLDEPLCKLISDALAARGCPTPSE